MAAQSNAAETDATRAPAATLTSLHPTGPTTPAAASLLRPQPPRLVLAATAPPPAEGEELPPPDPEGGAEDVQVETTAPAQPQRPTERSNATSPGTDKMEAVRAGVVEDRRRLEELRRLRILAEARMRALQASIDALRNSGDREQQRVRNLQFQLGEEKATADQLAAEIGAVNQSLDEARQALDEGHNQRERLRWIVGAIALLVLVGGSIVAFLLFRSRRRTRDLERTTGELKAVEERRARAQDWALESANRKLKLPGAGLSDRQRGVVVGRSTEVADVLIEGSEISRRHARFHLEDDRLYVTDLDSLNGVKVNNRRIPANSPQEVRTGDQISIATSDFDLRCL